MRRFLLSTILLISSHPIHAAESYGPIESGDSLWVISRDHRPMDATINQMMIATFRRNPDAFGGNINWLYVHRMLALPAATEARARLPKPMQKSFARMPPGRTPSTGSFLPTATGDNN